MMFSLLDKILGSINRSIAAFGIAAGVAMAFINVVARYGFNSSITWASELTNYFFIWSAFFGAAYCFKKDAHISVTILMERLPAPIMKALMILSHILVVIYLAAVAYYGYKYLLLEIDMEEVSVDLVVPQISWLGMSDDWAVPMWIPYSVIPLAFASAAIRVFEKLVEIIKTPAELARRESEAEMILAKMQESEDESKEVELEKTLEIQEKMEKIERIEEKLEKIEKEMEKVIFEEIDTLDKDQRSQKIKKIKEKLQMCQNKLLDKIKKMEKES